jgi:hypothetical protein
MNPLYIAAAALGLFFVASAGGTAAAASSVQETMVFKDYAWTIQLPSTQGNILSPGPMPAAVVQNLPPPPGATPGSGSWFEYPQGMQLTSPIHNAVTGQTMTPGTPLNPIIQPWGNVPAGQSIFMWKPNKGILQKLGGFWVTSANWKYLHQTQSATGTLHGFYPNGSIPSITWATPLPPPPGESSKTGKWHQAQPGYFVWLTPTNANSGELGQQIFTLNIPSSTPAALPPSTPQPVAAPVPATTTAGAPFFGAPAFGPHPHAYPSGLPHFG